MTRLTRSRTKRWFGGLLAPPRPCFPARLSGKAAQSSPQNHKTNKKKSCSRLPLPMDQASFKQLERIVRSISLYHMVSAYWSVCESRLGNWDFPKYRESYHCLLDGCWARSGREVGAKMRMPSVRSAQVLGIGCHVCGLREPTSNTQYLRGCLKGECEGLCPSRIPFLRPPGPHQ
jgi:hypothetical protein